MKIAPASALTTPQNLLSLPAEPAHTLPTSRRDGECEQGEAAARAEARASKSKSTERVAPSRLPKETKGNLSGGEKPRAVGPSYRPELETGTTPDLFGLVDVVDEYSLGKRLVQAGVDLYCAGDFATFTDRLRHVIVREQLATAVCGRDNADRIETYEQAFRRVTGEPLVRRAGAKR